MKVALCKIHTFLGCVKLSMSFTSSTRSPAMFLTDSHRLFSVKESSVGSQKLTSLKQGGYLHAVLPFQQQGIRVTLTKTKETKMKGIHITLRSATEHQRNSCVLPPRMSLGHQHSEGGVWHSEDTSQCMCCIGHFMSYFINDIHQHDTHANFGFVQPGKL